VNGNRSAIEIEGEIPGKAPPRIPQATPANAAGTMGVVKGLGSDSKFKVQRFTVQGSVHGSRFRFTVHGSVKSFISRFALQALNRTMKGTMNSVNRT
jgi:hypothetical protein